MKHSLNQRTLPLVVFIALNLFLTIKAAITCNNELECSNTSLSIVDGSLYCNGFGSCKDYSTISNTFTTYENTLYWTTSRVCLHSCQNTQLLIKTIRYSNIGGYLGLA